MARPERIVVATGNQGKLEEMAMVLADLPYTFCAQSEFGVPEAIESGLTFVENALIKARNAAAFTGLAALADDSGLEVDALNGAPGIFSSRFAGPDGDAAANNRLLLDVLASTPDVDRGCRFRCVIVLLRHPADPTPLIATGTWEGRVRKAPSGEGGFGYDPLFEVPELSATAAELPAAEKNRRSHRGRALAALKDMLAAPRAA